MPGRSLKSRRQCVFDCRGVGGCRTGMFDKFCEILHARLINYMDVGATAHPTNRDNTNISATQNPRRGR